MDLSIVDFSRVPPGGTATDAFENTVEAAQKAERLGFKRFWVAEHHGAGDTLAGTSPEVLLGHLAAKTDSIRIGSGALLLNHYAPFAVAEQFGTLDALAPGRIDLGIGGATGSAAVSRALNTDGGVQDSDAEYDEKIESVLNYLFDDHPDDHEYSDLEIPRSGDGAPVPWILGSSPSSAELAGELGLRYCFAAFINPGDIIEAFERYREHFRPSEDSDGLKEPKTMIAVNAICAATDREASRLRAVDEASFARLAEGELDRTPSVESLESIPDPIPKTLELSQWPQTIAGSPETLRSLFNTLSEQVGIDEIMLQYGVTEHDVAIHSQELIAEEFLDSSN